MDCVVHGVAKSQTWLSDFHFTSLQLEVVIDFIFLGSKITRMVTAAMMLAPWKESYDKPRQCIQKQRHHFADKGPYSQSYGFSSSQAQMWELDHKGGWAPKNWCFWIVMLEKTLAGPFDCKEIEPVNSKGDQLWLPLEGLMLKLKLQYFGHLMWRVTVKDPDAGKDRGQEKRVSEDEMVE